MPLFVPAIWATLKLVMANATEVVAIFNSPADTIIAVPEKPWACRWRRILNWLLNHTLQPQLPYGIGNGVYSPMSLTLLMFGQ
jgi:hypothetical protein